MESRDGRKDAQRGVMVEPVRIETPWKIEAPWEYHFDIWREPSGLELLVTGDESDELCVSLGNDFKSIAEAFQAIRMFWRREFAKYGLTCPALSADA